MKVTRIEIKDFNQFKNLDIDLTYPKGHAKEGQPLDKVCFIGQSGTGKTTLLNLINDYIGYQYKFKEKVQNYSQITIHTEFIWQTKKCNWSIEIDPFSKETIIRDNPKSVTTITNDTFQNVLKDHKGALLINFPVNLNYEIPTKTVNYDFRLEKFIDLNKNKIDEVWSIVLDKVKSYHEQVISYRQELANSAILENSNLVNAQENFNIWKSKNPNPLEVLSNECLEEILNVFKIKLKTEFEFKTKNDIGALQFVDFSGNPIPNGLLSTGIKQLLNVIIPLHYFKPKDAIILIDEPENSLYPNIQFQIAELYKKQTKDSQFFYATHSPIIASSFEPWEIVELKLDENGHVYQDKYYEGDRHIGNYSVYPQYLDYDSMLSEVFDLKETYNPLRSEKLTEILMLKNHLLKLKKDDKTKTKEFEDEYIKFKRLAERLAWDFELI